MAKEINTRSEEAKIQYSLRPVPPKARGTSKGEGPYAAHVKMKPASFESIAAQMVREGSKYEKAELVAIMTKVMDTVAHRLTNGESVNLGSMVRLRPAIRGTFETLATPFNAQNHEVVVTATIGRKLRSLLKSAKVEPLQRMKAMPKLKQVTIYEQARESNGCATFAVNGSYLLAKYSKKPAEWFVMVNGRETIIAPVSLENNKALFMVPAEILPAGTTFQLGLRVFVTPAKSAAVLYKSPLTV